MDILGNSDYILDMTNEESTLQDQINDLQIKISYLEDFLNQLQEVTVEQTKEIDRLKLKNELMIKQIKDLTENAEGDIPNRKPPHY